MITIESICISEKKGEKKAPVSSALFLDDRGIQGDAHAGSGHRQVSILSAEDIEKARESIPDLKPGAFAENIILKGANLSEIGVGSEIALGNEVLLSVTQIGKECHSPCSIAAQTGDCIMPKTGLFARVKRGGSANSGDTASVDHISRSTLQAVVLTISDRCSRGEAEDTAGPAAAELLKSGIGANIYRTKILPDDQEVITESLKHYSNGHSIDLIVTAGGTGFSPSDVTPEAVAEVIDRPTPGLDEAMRASSMAKTPHAMLSRAVSGIRKSTLIISLPGSLKAATENLEAVLPALEHGLLKLRGDKSDCGRTP